MRPTVSAGPDQAATLAAGATLDGTVNDDGLPNPPGSVTTQSSVVAGREVTFGDANLVDTTASFSAVGTYVLRLTANDSALSASDDVTINVTTSGGVLLFDRRVSASTDDAEENSTTGAVDLTSSDPNSFSMAQIKLWACASTPSTFRRGRQFSMPMSSSRSIRNRQMPPI